ncbi:MAG: hypothetical protein AMS15_01260 [Planctomycetes bacterium DG_23]|nr:MAG: hypothetical protein AMS15_01260 [Planctomycetes bacterium DG_23]
MRKLILWIVGILLSVIFLWLALRGIDFAQLRQHLASIRFPFIILAIIFMMLGMYLRGVRWKFILRPTKDISSWSCFSVLMIGFMANNFLPFRGGEFIRMWLLSRKAKVSKSLSLGTIVAERFFDMLVLVLILVAGIVGSGAFPPVAQKVAYIGGGIFIVFSALILFSSRQKERTVALSERFLFFLSPRWRKPLMGALSGFLGGLEVLRTLPQIVTIALLSFPAWAGGLLCFYFGLRAINISVTPWGLFFVKAISNLGTMLPAAPAYIGHYEFLVKTSLVALDKEANAALAFALVYHTMWFLVLTAVGLYFFWKEHLSWARLKRLSEVDETPPRDRAAEGGPVDSETAKQPGAGQAGHRRPHGNAAGLKR